MYSVKFDSNQHKVYPKTAKKASSIPCDYRKCRTCALVLSRKLVNEKSKIEIRQKKRGRKQAVKSENREKHSAG